MLPLPWEPRYRRHSHRRQPPVNPKPRTGTKPCPSELPRRAPDSRRRAYARTRGHAHQQPPQHHKHTPNRTNMRTHTHTTHTRRVPTSPHHYITTSTRTPVHQTYTKIIIECILFERYHNDISPYRTRWCDIAIHYATTVETRLFVVSQSRVLGCCGVVCDSTTATARSAGVCWG